MGARTQARRSINGKSSAQRENGDGRGSGGLPPVAPLGAAAKRRGVIGPIWAPKKTARGGLFCVPRAGAYLAKRGKYSDSLIKSEMAL